MEHTHLSVVKPHILTLPERERDSRSLKSMWVRFSHDISYNNKLLVCSFLAFGISPKDEEPAPKNSQKGQKLGPDRPTATRHKSEHSGGIRQYELNELDHQNVLPQRTATNITVDKCLKVVSEPCLHGPAPLSEELT